MSKTQFKNGYFHLVTCLDGKQHFFETKGTWFQIDEVHCVQHKYLAAVVKPNLRKHDWEISGLKCLKR